MARTALVVGATGLVGGHVIDRLVARDEWSRILVLARRSIGRTGEKIAEHIVDFEKLASDGASLDIGGATVDDVFCCLGTTIKVAGSQDRFRRVDQDYTVAVARLARSAGACRLALVSSIGASETTGNFYLRVKGETERDVRALGYETVIIARPSYLLGERTERRTAESAGIAVASALAPLMLGGLRAYRPIRGEQVAAALVNAIAAGDTGVRVLTYADLVLK